MAAAAVAAFAAGCAWSRPPAAPMALAATAKSVERSAVDDPVVARGLRHSDEGRATVAKAIESANTLLRGAASDYRLYGSWNSKPNGAASAIPVYLVATYPAAHTTPAAVPVGCTCAFVNPESLASWIAKHGTGSGRLELDEPRLLGFMLLHEVGHLVKNSTGMDFENGELSELNTDPSIAKAHEEDADEFASGLVRKAMLSKPVSDASIEANWVATSLVELSWNMQAHRSLDEFGATAIGKPAVFFDPNLSHPNLDWRILRSNYLIQQTPQAKALLDSFVDARHRGEDPEPLYQADPGK